MQMIEVQKMKDNIRQIDETYMFAQSMPWAAENDEWMYELRRAKNKLKRKQLYGTMEEPWLVISASEQA